LFQDLLIKEIETHSARDITLGAALLQLVIRPLSAWYARQAGISLVVCAALGLSLVSVFTFRIAEGFLFSIGAMVACALAYGLVPSRDEPGL
jgi:hypothetical protein